MKGYVLNKNDIQVMANDVKDLVIDNLATDGLLKVSAEEAGEAYCMVVKGKGGLGRFLEKIFPTPDIGYDIVLLKLK